MEFNETELGIITNALRVAAEKFRDDVAQLGEHTLAETFAKQAREADALYEKIADETGICN